MQCFVLNIEIMLNDVVFSMLQVAQKRSDVVLIISDIIFPA